jgi:RNA methyltransferase, TrmH family
LRNWARSGCGSVFGAKIMSAAPKSLKRYRELADKKGRLEQGFFLVEGEKHISQVVAAHPEAITEIIAIVPPPPALRRYPLREVKESEFRYISAAQTPQGIAAVVRLPEGVYSPALPPDAGSRILLLEDVQDPGNVGTLIRTAAALGFSGVILTDASADPFSPKCVQAAAGTVLSLWIRKTTEYLQLVNSLKQAGYAIVGADVRGDSKPEILPSLKKVVLALGNEAAGLSKDLLDIADHRVRIATPPEKAESLNVAACGAILMYLASV